MKGTLQGRLEFQPAIVVSKWQIRVLSLPDWKHMTFLFAVVRCIPPGGLLWKYTSAGCKALGVNPCWLELIETIITSALTSQLSWAAARCLAGNSMWQFGFGAHPSARIHKHAARTWESEQTVRQPSVLFPHHIHPSSWDASCPTAPQLSHLGSQIGSCGMIFTFVTLWQLHWTCVF